MLMLKMYLILIIIVLIKLSEQSIENRIIGYNGERLPIYIGLHYAIRNKESGFLFPCGSSSNGRLFEKGPDDSNAAHWMKFYYDVHHNWNNHTVYTNDITNDNYCLRAIDNYYMFCEY